MLCAKVPDMCFTVSASLMSTFANVAVETGSVLQKPAPYAVDKYILQNGPRLDAHQLKIKPVGQDVKMNVANEEHETAYTGWRRRWQYCGGCRNNDGYMPATFMDVHFVCSFDEVDYKNKLVG